MAEINVKRLFRSVGINLNDEQMEVIQSLLGSSGGSDSGSNITEITEQNIEEAANATNFIVVKIGADPYLKEEINENEYGYGLNIYSGGHMPSRYYLFYAVINNNVVSLPISLLHHFTIKGKPVIGVKNYYKIANYGERDREDKQWRTVISLVNVNEKTFTLDEGNNKFSDAVYINSEIIPLGIEIPNFPKFNDNYMLNESNFYNYQLVSNDFEGKLKPLDYNGSISYLDSGYIRSERFNNGLVGINTGISKSLLNTSNSFICVTRIRYNTPYKEIPFDENEQIGFDFTSSQYLGGYAISGVYRIYAQFALKLYLRDGEFNYSFDNWAITKDNITDFINLMVTNKVEEDLGYGAIAFYNFQLINKTINSGNSQFNNFHVIDSNDNVLNITDFRSGYYFTLCGNISDNHNSVYELIFINVENETFENGELLYKPILIVYRKQDNEL